VIVSCELTVNDNPPEIAANNLVFNDWLVFVNDAVKLLCPVPPLEVGDDKALLFNKITPISGSK